MELFDLTGQVAVVTGSTRGIGLAIAERLAEHGARVVISSRKPEACTAVADRINLRLGSDTALAIPANISMKPDIERLMDRVESQWGPVSILVCNAASNPYYGPMGGIADDAFRKVLDNNILSNHWLVQRALPAMLAARNGSIILISSIGGLQGSPTLGAYCISKAAEMQLARNLAVEHGPDNVRVNCIAPGIIRTDFSRALWEDPAIAERVAGQCPLRRFGEPDDVAGVAVMLASRAGKYITGQTLVVDGGDTVT